MALSDMTFLEMLNFAYLEIFSFDGFDVIEQRKALKEGKYDYYLSQPHFNNWARFAAFIGWPNRQRNLDGQGTIATTPLGLVKNFFGYTDPSPSAPIASSKVMNYFIKPIVFVPLHLIKMLFTFPLSVVKSGIEYPFLVGLLFSGIPLLGSFKETKDSVPLNKRHGLFGTLFFIAVFIPSYFFYFQTRAITSPFKAVRLAWWEGKSAASRNSDSIWGKIIGTVFVFASLLTTLHMYAWLGPLLLQTVGGAAVPPLIDALPSAFSTIGTIAAIAFKISAVYHPALVGLFAVATAAFEILGLPTEYLFLSKIRNKYFLRYQDGGNKYDANDNFYQVNSLYANRLLKPTVKDNHTSSRADTDIRHSTSPSKDNKDCREKRVAYFENKIQTDTSAPEPQPAVVISNTH